MLCYYVYYDIIKFFYDIIKNLLTDICTTYQIKIKNFCNKLNTTTGKDIITYRKNRSTNLLCKYMYKDNCFP